MAQHSMTLLDLLHSAVGFYASFLVMGQSAYGCRVKDLSYASSLPWDKSKDIKEVVKPVFLQRKQP